MEGKELLCLIANLYMTGYLFGILQHLPEGERCTIFLENLFCTKCCVRFSGRCNITEIWNSLNP